MIISVAGLLGGGSVFHNARSFEKRVQRNLLIGWTKCMLGNDKDG